MDQFRLLSCLRKGPLGVDALNSLILSRLLEGREEEEFFIAPILITASDSSSGLMNGDAGILMARVSSWRKHCFGIQDTAYFLGHEGVRLFSGGALPAFELGYCLSVHKSQGSEYENVLVLVPSGSEEFGREILYTAITRAKKELLLLSEETTLSMMIKKSCRRRSGLVQRSRC